MDLASVSLEQFMKANLPLSVKRIRQQAEEQGLDLPSIQDRTLLIQRYYEMLQARPAAPPPPPPAPVADPAAPQVILCFSDAPRGYWCAGHCFRPGRHEFPAGYFGTAELAEIKKQTQLRVI